MSENDRILEELTLKMKIGRFAIFTLACLFITFGLACLPLIIIGGKAGEVFAVAIVCIGGTYWSVVTVLAFFGGER